MTATSSLPDSRDPMGKPASWVIRRKDTGEAVAETSSSVAASAINSAKYEVVPVLQHLQELNASLKAERQRERA